MRVTDPNRKRLSLNAKSKKAYQAGIEAARSGLSETDNPYLSYPAAHGGIALSAWWSSGLVAGRQKNKSDEV